MATFKKLYQWLSPTIQTPPLFGLPNELLLTIAENLAVKDIKSFLQVNRHLSCLLTPTFQRIALKELKPLQWDDFTALHWAAYRHHEPLVRLLLDRGFEVDKPTLSEGATPLHYAAMSGAEPVVRLLLDRGANIESRDRVSPATLEQPMYLSRGKLITTIVKLHGMTPLHYAVMAGRERIVRVLLDAGAQIDARDKVHGKSALHIAAGVGWKMTKLLLERGADIDVVDGKGLTPIDYTPGPMIPYPFGLRGLDSGRNSPRRLLTEAAGRRKSGLPSRK